jgi:hypothetical protein
MKIIIEDIDSGIKVTSEPNITCRNITIYKEPNNKLGSYDNKYLQALHDHFIKIGKEK